MRHRTSRCWQCNVNGVGVAAEIVARLEEREVGSAGQRVCRCQARNSGANDGNALRRDVQAVHFQSAEYKNVAKRPDTNKRGREEEERPGISSGPEEHGWLRNNETVFLSVRSQCGQREDKTMSFGSRSEFPLFE